MIIKFSTRIVPEIKKIKAKQCDQFRTLCFAFIIFMQIFYLK